MSRPRISGVPRDYSSARAVSREELTKPGVLGLLRALERYDPAPENHFWGYAQWWVRQAMQELVSSLNNAVVLPDRALRHLARVNAARRDRLQTLGTSCRRARSPALTGLPGAQVDMLVAATQPGGRAR